MTKSEIIIAKFLKAMKKTTILEDYTHKQYFESKREKRLRKSRKYYKSIKMAE